MSEQRSSTPSFEDYDRLNLLKSEDEIRQLADEIEEAVNEDKTECAKQYERTILYLKQMLLLKDKRIKQQALEITKYQLDEANSPYHKQIFTLVSTLQQREEHVNELNHKIIQLEEQNRKKDEQLAQKANVDKQLEEATHKIKHLNDFVNDARMQIRQLTHQKEQEERNAKYLTQDLEETKAKFGQLLPTQAGKVIQKQKEFAIENKELHDRLALSNLQIQELKAIKLTIENELYNAQVKERKQAESFELEKEAHRRRLRQELESRQRIQAQMKEIEKEVQQLRNASRLSEEKANSFAEKYQAVQQQYEYLKKDYEIIENENHQLRNRLEELAKDHEMEVQELRALRKRLQIASDQLVVQRKDLVFKDSCIRSLQEQIKSLNSAKNNSTYDLEKKLSCSPGKKKESRFLSWKKSNVESVKNQQIENLQHQLGVAREAANAHQLHSSFMQSELTRVLREKNLDIELKNETIDRLRDELSFYRKLVSDYQMNRANETEEQKQVVDGSFSPTPERIKQRMESKPPGSEKQQDTIDELRSTVALLKKYYFRSLALGIKFQLQSEHNVDLTNVNIDMLSEICPESLPVQDWANWLQTEITKLAKVNVFKQQAKESPKLKKGSDPTTRKRLDYKRSQSALNFKDIMGSSTEMIKMG